MEVSARVPSVAAQRRRPFELTAPSNKCTFERSLWANVGGYRYNASCSESGREGKHGPRVRT